MNHLNDTILTRGGILYSIDTMKSIESLLVKSFKEDTPTSTILKKLNALAIRLISGEEKEPDAAIQVSQSIKTTIEEELKRIGDLQADFHKMLKEGRFVEAAECIVKIDQLNPDLERLNQNIKLLIEELFKFKDGAEFKELIQTKFKTPIDDLDDDDNDDLNEAISEKIKERSDAIFNICKHLTLDENNYGCVIDIIKEMPDCEIDWDGTYDGVSGDVESSKHEVVQQIITLLLETKWFEEIIRFISLIPVDRSESRLAYVCFVRELAKTNQFKEAERVVALISDSGLKHIANRQIENVKAGY